MTGQSVPYEKPFQEGEVLLVFFQNEPAFFIRIENILADKKRNWWHVQFLTLTLPINEMSWILSDDHIRGAEFTMQNNPVRLKRVIGTQTTPAFSQDIESDNSEYTNLKKARIISLFDDEE